MRLTGPVVIGDGCRIGERRRAARVVVWPRTDVPEQAMLIGAIAGDRPLAERLGPQGE